MCKTHKEKCWKVETKHSTLERLPELVSQRDFQARKGLERKEYFRTREAK